MKLTMRLILSLIAIISIVACLFSFWQARQEEVRLKSELERRAIIIADSLKMSVEPLLSAENTPYLQRIVDRFSNRERLVGISIHDIEGNLVLTSTDLRPRLQENPEVIALNILETRRLNAGCGEFMSSGRKQLHIYSVPLSRGETISHVLTIFHNCAYIQERVNRIWVNSFWRALVQALLITLVTLIIIYLNIMAPIRHTTEWIKKVRRGESPEKLSPKDQALLGPLAHEISKMAKSLDVARMAAEEEARLRHSSEAVWTPERLKEFVRDKLGGRPLFIVSNREPYMHIRKGKEIECIVPASGLVTALEPVLNACGGTWIAQGSGDADHETVDKNDRLKVPPEEPQYVLRRVWVDKEREAGFYFGFSNEGLWPLCHIAHTRPTFRDKDWKDYQAVNTQFADATLKELTDVNEPCVLIQDYHFALLPQLIKAKRPDARVAIFWHIPWPNPESFSICPWQKELLVGMLGADLIGFHTQFHCNNFIETVDRFLESRIDYEHFTVNREGQTTWIKPFPISIAFLGNMNLNNHKPEPLKETKESLLKKYGIKSEFLGVGVDRLDYTKGILERLRAVEQLLEAHPLYVGRFTFVELGAPSRTTIEKYKEFENNIEKEAQRINARFKNNEWQPILFLKKHHTHEEIAPFYRLCDVCMVTSLHDGMNLVAKEFVVSRDDEKGVLILSQFTGAARELKEALIVNPYDVGQTAQAIRAAIEMPAGEQGERMRQMRNTLKDHNVYKWASHLIEELARIRVDNSQPFV